MSASGIRKFTAASRNSLRALVEEAFTLEELQLLCADLGVDHENLGGGMKSVRVLNLITMLERHGRAGDLAARFGALRPAIEWRADYDAPVLTAHPEPPAEAEAPRQKPPVFINGLPTKAPSRPTQAMVVIDGAGLDIPTFQVDAFPATNADYLIYLEKNSGASAPANWAQRRPAAGTEMHPVVGVSFSMAEAYARWLGKRLPTVKEWLAAASCGAAAYPWGDAFDAARANCERVRNGTTPVDAYPGGASAQGVHDLAGNAWEWTQDEVAPRGLSKGKQNACSKAVHGAARASSWRAARRSRFGPTSFKTMSVFGA